MLPSSQGRLHPPSSRIVGYGSAWLVHHDGNGKACGWEERDPQWRGFCSGGAKVLFRFGGPTADRLCVTGAAIDALSLAAIEGERLDTLYASIAGGWSPATELAVRDLAGRIEILVAATDRNSQGEAFADNLRRIAAAGRLERGSGRKPSPHFGHLTHAGPARWWRGHVQTNQKRALAIWSCDHPPVADTAATGIEAASREKKQPKLHRRVQEWAAQIRAQTGFDMGRPRFEVCGSSGKRSVFPR
ncbi:DUF3991 domain-containing protein [Agrobacterium tumefaciens]|uniref:DUF3991 domain-containing protein n=1 Tax=Agrobacterium tumefaciens TaxID=358 RepID=UPI003AF9BE1E